MNKVIFLALLLFGTSILLGQSVAPFHTVERNGFTFGFGIGAGVLTLSANDTTTTTLASTLPNLHFGYMVNNKLAFNLLALGSPYKYKGKARGFEGLVFTSQYWLKDKWWFLGGLGLTLDAPAFWTVKKLETADFNFGAPAWTFATGYELLHKKRFTLDVQYRIYGGQAKMSDETIRKGVSNMIVLGFNWY